MNLTEIQNLIKFVSKSGVSEVEIEQKDFKIIIKTNQVPKKGKGAVQELPMVQQVPLQIAQVPVSQMAPVTHAAAPIVENAAPVEEKNNYIEVKSPMIGTFYRSSAPDKPTFVEVGNTIKPGEVVCIIEAMKLFNEIESEVSGKIVKILVDDSTPVEYDQPLFLVDPS